jgi:O-antigen/teichoic acid export membrane protein
LGIWITPDLLGKYALALNIVLAIEGIVSRPFISIAMPAFSEVLRRGDGNLHSVHKRLRLPFDIMTIAGAGFVFACAEVLVGVLYDSRYAEVGSTLKILSVTLLFIRYQVTAAAHVALGEPRTASISNVVRAVSIVIAIPAGYALGGYYGAIWAIALHMIPATIYLFVKNRKHGLNDFTFEVNTLLAWPAGFALGFVVEKVGSPLLQSYGWL